ncbi:Reverse transcriptase domain-containing protein [Aphis craccivora]|uniref:Reverse transcriptase domain-containing protein n=1 Tax=Aphis craccivora TaxID=307492 RepID=A0A6G0YQG0_APHCR|nr:Reverse transcriptase domain-containing protein [Aphis craccivora]
MPSRALFHGKRQVHWWNSEIAALRKTAIAARRAYQRAGRRTVVPSREPENEVYKKAKRELKIAIKNAQEECWRELCRSVENDPWIVPYKLVTKRLGRRAPDLDSDMVARVARGLFPESPSISWDHVPIVLQQPSVIVDLSLLLADSPLVPPVTMQEVKAAVDRLPSKKVPGPDHIPNEIIKLAFPKFPDVFVECYNRCLNTGTFPARWKRAKLVLLYKGQGKALDQPSSYRPLMAVAHNAELVEELVNLTLVDVIAWMTENGLRLTPDKTESVVLTNKKKYRDPNLIIQGCRIPVKRAIRYLGIRLDTRLSYVEHTTTVAAGARKAGAALGRLMPNIGGPTQSKRRLLMSVVMSRLLYGAEIWAEPVLSLLRTCNTLLQAQRCAALRVARCYRTVSDMASLVLAKMPPASLKKIHIWPLT